MLKTYLIKQAIITGSDGNYTLHSHKGKVLGHHKSKASAKRQEAAIWAHKNADFAPGLPDRKRFGDTEEIPEGKLLQYVVQRHNAARAGLHHDVRLGGGPKGNELFSWATKKELPKPGGKIVLYQQPLHKGSYADFQGTIVKGYGRGTVATADKGNVIVTHAGPDKIKFVVTHHKYPEYYTMVKKTGMTPAPRTEREKVTQGGSWLLINTTPMDAAKFLGGKPGDVGLQKMKYTSVPANDVEKLFDPKYLTQQKIDGASMLFHLLSDKIEAVSYRTGAGGRPIIHSHRIFGPTGSKLSVKMPPNLVGTILRGETYGQRGNKVIPPQELGGILNSSVSKSLAKQKEQHIKMKNMLFDVVREGKTPIAPGSIGAEERLSKLENIVKYLPREQFELPETARTPDASKKLWERIISHRHPQTSEGIVAWPKDPGLPVKAKAFPESDVYIQRSFPGEGKYKGTAAGGFEYSLGPNGPTVGKVGTGLSDESRRELLEHPEEWIGRLARIKSQGQFPESGAHRAPVFISRHEDYSPVKAANHVDFR